MGTDGDEWKDRRRAGDARAIQSWVAQMFISELDRPGVEEYEDSDDAVSLIIWRTGVWVYDDIDSAFAAFRQLVERRYYPDLIGHVPLKLWRKMRSRAEHYSVVDDSEPSRPRLDG